MPKPKRAVIRDDGERFNGFEPKQYTPSAGIKGNRPFASYHYSYRDPQGFYFDRQEFSQRPFIQEF